MLAFAILRESTSFTEKAMVRCLRRRFSDHVSDDLGLSWITARRRARPSLSLPASKRWN